MRIGSEGRDWLAVFVAAVSLVVSGYIAIADYIADRENVQIELMSFDPLSESRELLVRANFLISNLSDRTATISWLRGDSNHSDNNQVLDYGRDVELRPGPPLVIAPGEASIVSAGIPLRPPYEMRRLFDESIASQADANISDFVSHMQFIYRRDFFGNQLTSVDDAPPTPDAGDIELHPGLRSLSVEIFGLRQKSNDLGSSENFQDVSLGVLTTRGNKFESDRYRIILDVSGFYSHGNRRNVIDGT